jgi:plastocyanin
MQMSNKTQQKCLRGRWPKQARITFFSFLSTIAISPLLVGCGSKPAPPPIIEATLVGSGTIGGRVTLEGTPPEERELPLDAACTASCKDHGEEMPRFTRTYVTKDGGLGDVLVTVVDIPAQPVPAGTGPLVIDQRGCEYHPYVAACQVGQTIQVNNRDPLTHNIHTLPEVSGNKEVNKSQAAKAKELEFVYEKPEEFLKFKCDVHPWMFTYVSVLNHPFFAVSSEDGHFEIKGLPDGKYKVKFKHRKAGEKIEEVEVKDGQATIDVVLTIPAA